MTKFTSKTEEKIAKKMEILSIKSQWEAIEKFEKTKTVISSNDLYINVGIAKSQLGKFKEACSIFSKILDRNPLDVGCRFLLGSCMIELGKYDEAESNLLKCLALIERPSIRLMLGIICLKTNKVEWGRRILIQGTKLNPNNIEMWEIYADYLSDIGEEDKVKKIMSKIKNLAV